MIKTAVSCLARKIPDGSKNVSRIFKPMAWKGYPAPDGSDVWFDGENVCYSPNQLNHYNLNGDTWVKAEYGGDNASLLWTDGTNIYKSFYNTDYVLNKETGTWEEKTWNGFNTFTGDDVWTDGENIYCSNNGDGTQWYVLNKETDTWETKTWYGLTNIYATHIWTDGTNIYHGDTHVLNKETDTWEEKTWNISFSGAWVWTDGTNTYYSSSSGTYQYILNGDTWEAITWEGLSNIDAWYLWSDGTNIYYSNPNNGEQYILLPTNSKMYLRQSGAWVEYCALS